jgi:putative hydrolase
VGTLTLTVVIMTCHRRRHVIPELPFIPELDRRADLHVHSTFSDDAVSTLAANLVSGAAHGLHTIGMVDHVRRTTTWVPDLLAAARALDGARGVRVLCGVEAKVLDTAGAVDVPPDLPAIDYVLLADHQLPRPDGPMLPADAVAALAGGTLTADEVVVDLVDATVAALACWDRVVVAHPFSVLPKCGLHEDAVPDELVRHLGTAARAAGAAIEINEKWTCPTPRIARLLAGTGVTLTLSTDAHHEAAVGRYAYVAEVADQLSLDSLRPR